MFGVNISVIFYHALEHIHITPYPVFGMAFHLLRSTTQDTPPCATCGDGSGNFTRCQCKQQYPRYS